MTKFENKANELGLDVKNLSKALNKEVAEYYEGVDELNNLKATLDGATDEEAESIKNEIQELEEVLADFDELLVEKVEKYNLNKANYDEKLKKMAEGRERAKQAKAQAQVTPQVVQTQPTETQPTPPVEEPIAKVVDEPTPQPTQEEKPKEEKSDWTWLVLAGLVGAVTLGAVILRKK
jgi:DNA repair exonuclease SbcCD ATPase subunit